METNMKVNYKWTINKAKDLLIIQMEINILENFLKIKKMEMVGLIMLMALYILDYLN